MSIMDAQAGTLSRAETVLAALDEEQQAAAQAVSGPVCILAGAGTGKTRTITHRIAYGVHTGVYVPEQVLAVTFTARAAGELRGRLAALDVGGVQARTFHAAAMRQLRYFAPRVLGGPMPSLVENKSGWWRRRPRGPGCPPTARACATSPVRSSGRRPPWPRRTTTRSGPGGGPGAAVRGGGGRRGVRQLRVGEAAGRRARLRGPAAGHRLRAGGASGGGAGGAWAVPVLRRRRVPGRQPAPAAVARCLARRCAPRSASSATRTRPIHSFTGADPDYLLGFADRYPDAAVVKLERDYRSTPQVVALANRLIGQAPGARVCRASACSGSGRTGRNLHLRRAPRSAARAMQALIDDGTPASEIAALFRINAQSEVYERRSPTSASRTSSRAANGSSSGRRSREAVPLLRGAAAGGSDRGALVPTVRDVLASTGWAEHRPRPGGAARDRWQSLAALVDLAVRPGRGDPDARPRRLRGHLADRANASMPPPCRAPPSRRCTRPRAWSGTPRSWWAWSTGWCRSRSRCPGRSRSTRSGGCSTWP